MSLFVGFSCDFFCIPHFDLPEKQYPLYPYTLHVFLCSCPLYPYPHVYKCTVDQSYIVCSLFWTNSQFLAKTSFIFPSRSNLLWVRDQVQHIKKMINYLFWKSIIFSKSIDKKKNCWWKLKISVKFVWGIIPSMEGERERTCVYEALVDSPS